MKKFILFLFTLVVGFSVFCGIKTKATGITLELSDNVGIRTAGDQGLRFVATASEDFDGSTAHGFYLAVGSHTKDEMIAAIAGGTNLIDGKPLVNKNTLGTDKSFAVTVIDIPTAYQSTVITAIAYYDGGEGNVYSNISVSKNVMTVAKELVIGGSEDGYITSIAGNARVKVTGSDTSVSYYADMDTQLAIKAGDTIELAAGTYSNDLTISANNVTIEGNKSYNLKHNDSYASSGDDTVLNCVVTVTGTNVDLSNFVFSKKIDVNGASNTTIHNCVTTTTNSTYLYAIGTAGSESTNLTVDSVAVAGSVNRFIYGYGAVINGLTVNNCCVLDSVTINSGSSVGICDFIRLGISDDNKSKGTITVTNCYIRAFQAGIHERKTGADVFDIRNNYFYDMPCAFYSKNLSTKTGVTYNITYNTFNSCLKADKGWDLIEIDPSVSKIVNINYNAFANTGTRANCYAISVLGTATADCTNNYFKGDPDQVVNGVTTTNWALEDNTSSSNTYDAYKIVKLADKYYIYGVNLFTE